MNEVSHNIQAGDMLMMDSNQNLVKVAIDPAGGIDYSRVVGIATSVLGEQIAVQYDHSLIERLMFSPPCRVCEKTALAHKLFPNEPEDHPFIKDNLDYLAWKYESNTNK